MDNQTLLNWLFGIAGSLASFVLKSIWDANTKLRADLESLNEKINREYVRRDDYRDDMTEIKGFLTRIYDKLEEKADKK